jgi:hypothetical protein
MQHPLIGFQIISKKAKPPKRKGLILHNA